MKTSTVSIIAALFGALGLLAIANGPVRAEDKSNCPALPDVEWWTNTVPDVRRIVATTYRGSWDAYIDRWKKQRHDLNDAYSSGKPVQIASRALVFRDKDLKDYIALVDERIAVLSCLKTENDDIAAVTRFETAAGTADPTAALPPSQVVAEVTSGDLNVEVSATCIGKTANFQVTNLGDRWPRVAEATIYRTDTSGVVSERKLRMANSQQMIFRVPTAVGEASEVGIFINPSWYERPFQFDATIKC